MRGGRLLGEFVVIVVGVLVALLLESALEGWQEGRLADRYEERLLAEARYNQEEFAVDEAWISEFCALGSELERDLWAAGGDPDSLLLRTFVLALQRTSSLRSATYRDLVATGNLGLLDDLRVRDRILGFYETQLTTVRAWRPTEENAYRAAVLPRVPSAWSGEIVDCARSADANRLRDDWRECARPPGGGSGAVLQRLRAVPGLREALAARSYDFCQYPGHQRAAVAALDSLMAALER